MTRSFRRLAPVTAVVALCLSASPATASPGAAREPASPLDTRISIDLEGAGAGQVFESFARVIEAELDLDPGVGGEVDLTVARVTARTALTAVCETLECTWRLEAGDPRRLVVRPAGDRPAGAAAPPPGLGTPISVALAGAGAREVLAGAAEVLGGAELILDPAVGGRVTLEAQDRPVAEILDRVCEQLGCRWRYDEGRPGALRVTPRR